LGGSPQSDRTRFLSGVGTVKYIFTFFVSSSGSLRHQLTSVCVCFRHPILALRWAAKTRVIISPMHDETTVQRFIELRASGWTYARLMTELNVTKPTLIAWSRKHQFQIQNLKAIELEALGEKWLASVTDRVNLLGEQLRKIETEISRRDAADLTTPQLYSLARSLRRQIGQATGSPGFTVPVAEIPADEYHEQVQDWQA
jgi:hypothetical protein